MTCHTRREHLAGAAAFALGLAAPALRAQTAAPPAWPSKPLRIVVSVAPGGTSDTIARLISKPLSDALGQPVVVENRPGANGNIGAAYVAQSTDEHTLQMCDVGALAISPLLYKSMGYQFEDLQGVSMLAYSPHLLVVHPSVPVKNLAELVAYSKDHPINVALPGTGSPNHLATVQLAQATGIRWQHVPYKGGAQALADTVAGNTQALLNGMLATLPMVKAGQLKVLGVSRPTRSPLLPEVPTLAEQGAQGFESGTWQGITAAARMSRPVVERLNAELVRIVRSPEIRARLTEAGTEASTMTPAETTQFIRRERERWARVIKEAGSIEGTA